MQMLRIQKWELLQRERSDCKQDERSKSHIVHQQEAPTQMTSTVVITGTKRVLTKLLKCQSHSKVVTFVILGKNIIDNKCCVRIGIRIFAAVVTGLALTILRCRTPASVMPFSQQPCLRVLQDLIKREFPFLAVCKILLCTTSAASNTTAVDPATTFAHNKRERREHTNAHMMNFWRRRRFFLA